MVWVLIWGGCEVVCFGGEKGVEVSGVLGPRLALL